MSYQYDGTIHGSLLGLFLRVRDERKVAADTEIHVGLSVRSYSWNVNQMMQSQPKLVKHNTFTSNDGVKTYEKESKYEGEADRS